MDYLIVKIVQPSFVCAKRRTDSHKGPNPASSTSPVPTIYEQEPHRRIVGAGERCGCGVGTLVVARPP